MKIKAPTSIDEARLPDECQQMQPVEPRKFVIIFGLLFHFMLYSNGSTSK